MLSLVSLVAFSTLMVTKADMDIVTRVVAGEARNQREPAIEGVCHVIYNRLIKRRMRSAADVVTARRQFSAINHDDPNREIVLAPGFKRTRAYSRVGRICRDTLVGRIQTSAIDTTNGADHYYSGTKVPYWARGHHPVARIGAFKFFRLDGQSRARTVRTVQSTVHSVTQCGSKCGVRPNRVTKEDRAALDALFTRLATRSTQ